MYTNRKRSENDQYNETSNHRQMKGYGGSGGSPRPQGSQPRCRRPLSFVYGLMSHCIDRFHFVFYLYTFHFMLPMCIRLIFLFLHIFTFYVSFYGFDFSCFYIFLPRYTLGYLGPLLLIMYYPCKSNIAIFKCLRRGHGESIRQAIGPWCVRPGIAVPRFF